MDELFKGYFDIWSRSSPRYPQFLAENKGKIEKNIKGRISSSDPESKESKESKLDLIFELQIPFMLLKDSGTNIIEYEPWKNQGGPSPDFLIETQGKSWCIDVKRIRERSDITNSKADYIELPLEEDRLPKLRDVILDALPQCRSEIPTIIWINSGSAIYEIEDLDVAMKQLSSETELLALSGVAILLPFKSLHTGRRSLLWIHPNAKCLLPNEAIQVLSKTDEFCEC